MIRSVISGWVFQDPLPPPSTPPAQTGRAWNPVPPPGPTASSTVWRPATFNYNAPSTGVTQSAPQRAHPLFSISKPPAPQQPVSESRENLAPPKASSANGIGKKRSYDDISAGSGRVNTEGAQYSDGLAFICGVQGGGKSHTTACMMENCSIEMPALGKLKASVSTLVLQFNEYSSNTNTQPSEAAILASVLPQYTAQQRKKIPLRVLVSPTNFYNLSKMYKQIPNVEVRQFRLQPRHLNVGMMLSLMNFASDSGSTPLYMAQVTKVNRVTWDGGR